MKRGVNGGFYIGCCEVHNPIHVDLQPFPDWLSGFDMYLKIQKHPLNQWMKATIDFLKIIEGFFKESNNQSTTTARIVKWHF